jgi:hypothetical protein
LPDQAGLQHGGGLGPPTQTAAAISSCPVGKPQPNGRSRNGNMIDRFVLAVYLFYKKI